MTSNGNPKNLAVSGGVLLLCSTTYLSYGTGVYFSKNAQVPLYTRAHQGFPIFSIGVVTLAIGLFAVAYYFYQKSRSSKAQQSQTEVDLPHEQASKTRASDSTPSAISSTTYPRLDLKHSPSTSQSHGSKLLIPDDLKLSALRQPLDKTAFQQAYQYHQKLAGSVAFLQYELRITQDARYNLGLGPAEQGGPVALRRLKQLADGKETPTLGQVLMCFEEVLNRLTAGDWAVAGMLQPAHEMLNDYLPPGTPNAESFYTGLYYLWKTEFRNASYIDFLYVSHKKGNLKNKEAADILTRLKEKSLLDQEGRVLQLLMTNNKPKALTDSLIFLAEHDYGRDPEIIAWLAQNPKIPNFDQIGDALNHLHQKQNLTVNTIKTVCALGEYEPQQRAVCAEILNLLKPLCTNIEKIEHIVSLITPTIHYYPYLSLEYHPITYYVNARLPFDMQRIEGVMSTKYPILFIAALQHLGRLRIPDYYITLLTSHTGPHALGKLMREIEVALKNKTVVFADDAAKKAWMEKAALLEDSHLTNLQEAIALWNRNKVKIPSDVLERLIDHPKRYAFSHAMLCIAQDIMTKPDPYSEKEIEAVNQHADPIQLVRALRKKADTKGDTRTLLDQYWKEICAHTCPLMITRITAGPLEKLKLNNTENLTLLLKTGNYVRQEQLEALHAYLGVKALEAKKEPEKLMDDAAFASLINNTGPLKDFILSIGAEAYLTTIEKQAIWTSKDPEALHNLMRLKQNDLTRPLIPEKDVVTDTRAVLSHLGNYSAVNYDLLPRLNSEDMSSLSELLDVLLQVGRPHNINKVLEPPPGRYNPIEPHTPTITTFRNWLTTATGGSYPRQAQRRMLVSYALRESTQPYPLISVISQLAALECPNDLYGILLSQRNEGEIQHIELLANVLSRLDSATQDRLRTQPKLLGLMLSTFSERAIQWTAVQFDSEKIRSLLHRVEKQSSIAFFAGLHRRTGRQSTMTQAHKQMPLLDPQTLRIPLGLAGETPPPPLKTTPN